MRSSGLKNWTINKVTEVTLFIALYYENWGEDGDGSVNPPSTVYPQPIHAG